MLSLMHLALQVLATARTLEQAGQRLFQPHDLTVAQFNVLHLLADQPAGLRASDLAAALVVDPSNITGLLKRMSAAGLLKELPSPTDGRQRIVTLSAKGRRLWEPSHREYRRRLDRIESRLTSEERRIAEKVLNLLATESAAP